MIELLRVDDCPACDETAGRLADLVIAHTVRSVSANELPPGTAAPVILDGDKTISGSELSAYLAGLGKLMADWDRFQSDACYLDDDGEVC
ncbi:MAG: hypothetical protein KJN71_02495 [Acidimicrobiia bacterium]|nr:hypothetical protein [Acidimicrobiia bacterium]NNC74535.1 hypothetical protein [Acidimicrobiia bacterium]